MCQVPCVPFIPSGRYPFLLVDRVVEIEYGKYAVGYKNITVNDQFFNGHFPERAIMPGEHMAPGWLSTAYRQVRVTLCHMLKLVIALTQRCSKKSPKHRHD